MIAAVVAKAGKSEKNNAAALCRLNAKLQYTKNASRHMTTVNGIPPTRLTDAGATNSLQRVADAATAGPNQQTGVARTRTRSNKVAQAFPTPGSIFSGPTRIPKSRTDAVIIGSFDPRPSFQTGGGVGFLYKYVEGPLASMVTKTPLVNGAETSSLDGIVNTLAAQKRLNGGQALSRISIVSHGLSGELILGNNSTYRVSQIVQPIMAKGLLKPGGRLVFGGCSIAGDTQACAELSGLAKKFNIVIQASEVSTNFGSENLAYMTFHPNGKITRNVGPFGSF
jgi:hypothetical protein